MPFLPFQWSRIKTENTQRKFNFGKVKVLTFAKCNFFEWWITIQSLGFPQCKSGCLQCGRPGFDPWVRKIPWRRKWHPTPVLLPGKFHGWRSLVGYSPWGRKESDTTERLHFVSLPLQSLSRGQLFETPWTVGCQAPLSLGFSRQEYWGGLSCPSPGDPPNPGIELRSLMSPALAGRFFTTSATWEAHTHSVGYLSCPLHGHSLFPRNDLLVLPVFIPS